MDNDDEKIKACFIGCGMSADVQLAFVRIANELRDAGFTLVEAINGLRQILVIEEEPTMFRRAELQVLTCREQMEEVELLLLIRNYGPETHIRPSNSVSRIRPSDFRSHIRPLRMLDSRSGMKGKTIRKRLGK